MSKWKMQKLSTLCTRIGDGLHGTPSYSSDSDIYFINGNNLKDGKIIIDSNTNKIANEELASNYIELNENSLLLSINGTLGSMAFYNGEKVMLGKSAAYLNFKTSINKFYYYYFQLTIIQKYFYDVATGSTIKNLSLKSLQDFEVPVPEDNEWEKITSVLSTLDNKIELNNKINAELEAMAKTLYDYWFVQFDFPDKNGKPYKSSGGKMVYNEKTKRGIPEGWEVKSLNDSCLTSLGGTPSTKIEEYWIGNINWLNSGEVANFPIINSDAKISQSAIINSATKLLKKGSVLISITRHLRANILGIDACVNQSVVGIEENDIYKKSFLYPFIINEIPRLMTLRTGAQQPHINKETVDECFILKPPKMILDKYYSISENIFDSIILNAKQNQELSILRDWLLPMLMNGQLGIGKTNQQDGEAINMAAELDTEHNKVVKLNIPKNKAGFAKQVLAGKIVSLFKEDKHFTHIKFQKLQFLAEHIAGADLNLNYYFQAAGPYDNRFMHTIADSFRKSKWFDERKYKFIPLENQNQIDAYYEEYFNPVSNQLSRLFELLADTTVSETEIIATVYAVWNNRIRLNQLVKESLLIEDFYNWSDRKKMYSKQQINKGLEWLIHNQMMPNGFGKLIKRAKGNSK